MRRLLVLVCWVVVCGCPDDPVDAPPADVGPLVDAGDTATIDGTEIDAPDSVDVPDPPPAETGPGLGIDYENEAPGDQPRYDPESTDWSAVGWPNDMLRLEDGRVDLSIFPNPGSELLQGYLDLGEEILHGFGLNGGVYFEMYGIVDVESLPDPAGSTDSLSVVQLVNVTPDSARYGQRAPLQFRWYATGFDPFYLGPTLVMRPVFGHPLAEGETYCAVITRGVKDAGGRHLSQAPGFVEALGTEPTLQPLTAWLRDSDLHTEDVSVASCFTTHVATAGLRAVREYLDEVPSPEVTEISEPQVYGEFHGTYEAPNFQAGEKPYEEGGDLQFDDDGAPIVQSQETLRFMLLIPRDQAMPPGGWPVIMYAHGTGGDYESCRGVSDELLPLGVALACIDQPLHGSRGPAGLEEELDYVELVSFSFNFLNPRAGRTNFRQAAIDSMVLGRMLFDGRFDVSAGATVSGDPLQFDPDRIYFFGHSHGGLSGALLAGVDPLIKAAVLSGAGGGLINTILLRKDPLDISELLRAVLAIGPDEFDGFHPVLSVIQMMVDATDPINYAGYWLEDRHVFVTQGTADHASPAISNNTMVAAAAAPLIRPIAKSSLAHELRGLQPLDMPVAGNFGELTGALKQWQDGTHWVAFDNAEAEAIWIEFFRTLLAGEGPPVLGPGDATVAVGDGAVAGDTCETAGVLDADSAAFFVRGNTSLMADDYTDCVSGKGATRRDAVFAFTPTVSADYRFRLAVPPKAHKDDPPTGPDLLYVTTDCAAAAETCVGQIKSGELWSKLEPGTTYYVIVDGSSLQHVGPFSVEITRGCEHQECGDRVCGKAGCTGCGTCPGGETCTEEGQCVAVGPGDRCDAPFEVGALPFVGAGDTTGQAPDYHYSNWNCPGWNATYGKASSDAAWHFTAPEADTYNVVLNGAFDSNLYVVSDCEDVTNTCLAANRRSGAERLNVTLEAGQEVFIIVDGAGNNGNSHGYYTLRVAACEPSCAGKTCGSDGCGGSCGDCLDVERCIEKAGCDPIPYICLPSSECEAIEPGDACSTAFEVTEVPFTGKNDTKELENDYSIDIGKSAPDVVYAFTPPASDLYALSLSAGFDTALYVVTDCADLNGSKVGSKNVNKKSGEKLYLTLDAAQTYYVVVDGASKASHKGTHTLTIKTCTPSCDGKVCGSDGCGGGCGGCKTIESCSGGQCKPRTGDFCDKPIKIDKLPYDNKGDDTGKFSDTGEAVCADPIEPGLDVFYNFDPKSSDTYVFTLSGALNGTLNALDACGGACLASGKTFELDVTKGEPIRLQVDGAKGKYTLKIKAKCVPQCDDKNCGSDKCGGACGTCEAPTDFCNADGVCTDPGTIEGNACSAPFVVGGLPFSGEGDTSMAFNHYVSGDEHCAGWVGKGGASKDQVWQLTAGSAGTYVIQVASEGFDSALYAVTDCLDIAGTCLGAADGLHGDTLTLALDAGQVVFVVVDGEANNKDVGGPYTLHVTGP